MRTKPLILLLALLTALVAFAGCGGADSLPAGEEKKAESSSSESEDSESEEAGEDGDAADDKMADDKMAADDSEGDSDATKEADGTMVVQIDVEEGELKFEKDSLKVPAGKVTFKSTNPDALEHNIAVKGGGVDEQGELVSNGDTSEVTVTLEKGKEYEFYCAPHVAADMKGTIEVV